MPLIPEKILRAIEEFCTLGKTGQIALNFHHGKIVSADARDHIKADHQISLDKSAYTD